MDSDAKVNILVVDDSPDKLLAMEAVLATLGERVVTARSGRDALRQLLVDDFAVILLDVNMPELDGFETAHLIRQRSCTEHTPIIFITAYSDDTHVNQGYMLGAVDYIVTPMLADVLRTKVQVFVDLYRKRREVERRAEERVALARLQMERDEADRANRAKSQFLANISHELRTPLNAIIGMTDLALQQNSSPTVRDYLETARSSADLLVALLNEILDYSRIESGRFSLEAAPFDLRTVVLQTVKSLTHYAREKGLELDCCLRVAEDMRVVGDSLRLRQVLNNLIGNAIKFTSEGEVRVNVAVQANDKTSATFAFEVKDTGIGISASDQQRIFSPFTQADASTTRRYGGAGLGLTIAANLVAMMGGKLELQSELGRGSQFSFAITLPRAAGKAREPRVRAKAEQSPESGGRESLRILLAEDTAANQKLITTVLGQRGHQVEIVENGADAVDAARRELFDLILMDVQMPTMDGFEATAAIRALAAPANATVPIVALTAHAMQGDENRCLLAGMDAYIAKPVDIRMLIEVVESLPRLSSPRLP